MPAKSIAQQKFMGADLARKRAGKPTQTSMSEGKLSEFASKKKGKKLPPKKSKFQVMDEMDSPV